MVLICANTNSTLLRWFSFVIYNPLTCFSIGFEKLKATKKLVNRAFSGSFSVSHENLLSDNLIESYTRRYLPLSYHSSLLPRFWPDSLSTLIHSLTSSSLLLSDDQSADHRQDKAGINSSHDTVPLLLSFLRLDLCPSLPHPFSPLIMLFQVANT